MLTYSGITNKKYEPIGKAAFSTEEQFREMAALEDVHSARRII